MRAASVSVILAVALAAAGHAAGRAAAAEPHDHGNPAAGDARELVHMPPAMQTHMLANMRDHLAALGEIQAALAGGDYGRAADIAENRIGMSSLEAHGAAHLGPYMPEPMQAFGTAMHRSASRFARVAQEAQMHDDVSRALAALADLTQRCTACHAGYRLP